MNRFLFLLLSSCALLTAEAAVASPRPSKRAFAHTNAAEGHNTHMQFRHRPHPLPILDLKAHDPEKFRTVHRNKNYKYK